MKQDSKKQVIQNAQKGIKSKRSSIINILNTAPQQITQDLALAKYKSKQEAQSKKLDLYNLPTFGNDNKSNKFKSKLENTSNIRDNSQQLNNGISKIKESRIMLKDSHSNSHIKQVEKPHSRLQFKGNSRSLSRTFTNFRPNSLTNHSTGYFRNTHTGQAARSKHNLHEGRNSTPLLMSRPLSRSANKLQETKQLTINDKNALGINIKIKAQLAQNSNSQSKSNKYLKGGLYRSGQKQKEKVQQKHEQNEGKSSYFSENNKKSIPQQIEQYIGKRQDVQIVKYFQEYKKQFYTKSKLLHNYIYTSQQPEKIKSMYLNESDPHFKNGLQSIMLKLYRNGTIVPNSFDNLRQEAVEQIQKWVIGWILRKISYGKLSEDQDNQVIMLQDAIKHLDQYKKQVDNEDTSF